MRKPLEPRTIATLFGAAILVLSWVSVASFWSTHRLVQSFDADKESLQILDKLQHIEVLMESAEASIRGYLISGNKSQLDAYRYAKLVVPYEMRQIETYFSAHPRRKAAWTRLNHLLLNRLISLNRLASLRRSEGPDAAARMTSGPEDKAKHDAMERLLSEVQQEERIQLELLRIAVSEHAWKTKGALILATLVSLGLLAWAFKLLDRTAGERRSAESATQMTETFLHSIVERIPYMILVKEAENLRLTLVNKAAEDWLGRPREELLGANAFDLHPDPEATAAMDKDRQALREGKLSDIPEEPLALPGQPERILHTQKIPIPDDEGNPAHLLTISEDITQRKQAERMLELSRDAAVEAARLRSEFIRNMSHEIRTPLSVVSGMTTLLLDTPLTPDQRRFAVMVQRAAEGLYGLSKSILDFSKIEAGAFSLDIQDVDIRQIVEDVTAMLGEQARAKGVKLACDVDHAIPPVLRGDPVRLRQVLTHLIGNAVKFTERGEVLVRLSLAKQDPAQVWLHTRISDTGIGIPQEVQPRLFEAFRQGDGSATRRFGGTGLGLAISKRLLELMGGEIGFESTAGRGSTFWFTVPMQRPQAAGAVVQEVSPSWARARALVVDENETLRQMIQQQLRGLSVASEAVSTGQAALDILRREHGAGRPYPVVILDMHLPDMDGVVFARKVKSDPALAGTKLLVMADASSALDPSAATAFGFSNWIAKPPKLEDLHERLAALIDPHKPLDQKPLS
jgi:PAS domain S-box-containing protein